MYQHREAAIENLANSCEILQFAEQQYTTEEWKLKLSETAFNNMLMEAALAAWRQEFEIADFAEAAQVEVEELHRENTRESKMKARKLVKDAFKQY